MLIADGDELLLSREYGAAAADDGTTAFWIASISKTVTAVGVLKLVEEGRIQLDAPVAQYLGATFPAASRITVRELLSHRSGLPHRYRADGIVDRDAAAAAILNQPVDTSDTYRYSNDGYTLLAILIEVASGERFEEYVRRRILLPAGMSRSGVWGGETPAARVASPARPIAPGAVPTTVWRNGRGVPNWGYRGATGLYSTPADLFAFVRSLAGGRLVDAATFRMMIASARPPEGEAQTYGYGWFVRFRDGQPAQFWHSGNESWLGHNGMLRVVGERIYIVLSNAGSHAGRSWAGHLEEAIRRCEPA